jgi:methylase of polypeptide subunit release factors
MVFSDYQEESVEISYLNIHLNLNIFQNQIQKFKFVQSDMLQNIKGKFDIIVANFP